MVLGLGYCPLEVVPLANSRMGVDVYWLAASGQLCCQQICYLDPQGEARASGDESSLSHGSVAQEYRCGASPSPGGELLSASASPLPFLVAV